MFKRFALVSAVAAALTFGITSPAFAQDVDPCEESTGQQLPEECNGVADDGNNGDEEDGNEDEGVVREVPQGEDPEVLGDGINVPEDNAAVVVVSQPEVAVLGQQQLPVTGSETLILGLAGFGLLAAGGVLVSRSRAASAS